jgi:hypothetical protein
MLAYTDVLLTLAAASATFAGFAAPVTLFARRRLEGTATHDLLRLRLGRKDDLTTKFCDLSFTHLLCHW